MEISASEFRALQEPKPRKSGFGQPETEHVFFDSLITAILIKEITRPEILKTSKRKLSATRSKMKIMEQLYTPGWARLTQAQIYVIRTRIKNRNAHNFLGVGV